ncbi:MAG: 2-dehydropantoate 2-reductase [Chloroflexota bacterium]
MRICIVGAGAIGGLLGARLIAVGEDVTLIARGAHLEAIRENGLTLQWSDGSSETAMPTLATDSMEAAGPQDVVIVAVKAQSLPALAPAMRPLYGPETMVVTAQNGIPWWYFYKHGGPYEGQRIEAVDPDGVIADHTEIDRVVGCVVYPAAEITQPGVIQHIEGHRFTLGELDGTKSDRIQQLSKTLISAGFKAPVRPRIRNEVWLKLWGNLAYNPISALTRATLIDIYQYPPTREVVRAMMAEAQMVGEKLGVTFGLSIEQRMAGAEEVGAHKTSTLQDIEAGRPTEIDALVGTVVELGRLVEIPTPHLDAIYASVKLLEQHTTK